MKKRKYADLIISLIICTEGGPADGLLRRLIDRFHDSADALVINLDTQPETTCRPAPISNTRHEDAIQYKCSLRPFQSIHLLPRLALIQR